MSMFDGLEEWMQQNRKPRKGSKKKAVDADPEEGLFDSFEKIDLGKLSKGDQAKEIADLLQKKFGGKVEVLDEGNIIAQHIISSHRSGNPTHSELLEGLEKMKTRMDMMMAMFAVELKKVGAKPHCEDMDGNLLEDGDWLDVPGNEQKKVLAVGFGYALLSHTEDEKRSDGVWFEKEIKKASFKKHE